jgi:signal transduction histidine kinase
MGAPELVNESFSSRQFSDCIAHELANPLNGMLVSVEVIERYCETNPRAVDEITDLLRILRNEIKRLVLLLDELRSSRVLAGINLQRTSLSSEIKELLALQSSFYEQRGIRVNQEIPLGLPFIMADKSKLRQIILNLCKNAVDAMPNGGTLTLRGYSSEEWVCLDIADTGGGIPEDMPVFEPAVTTKPQSSGLGLTIVREMITQLKGTVSYTSHPGNGTTFHLKLPIRDGKSLERPARIAPATVAR